MSVQQQIPHLFAEYQRTSKEQVHAHVEHLKLMDRASRGEARYEDADEYRHHTYLEKTEDALHAAQDLLAALDYYVRD